MTEQLIKIWKDPVFSKVIAAGICTAAYAVGNIYKKLDEMPTTWGTTIRFTAGCAVIYFIVIALREYYYGRKQKDSTDTITKTYDIANSNQTLENELDIKVCQKIFSEITSLSQLDFFIERALYPYMLSSVLEQYEEVERYLQSSNYHVFDNRLNDLIHDFYRSWSAVCQYSNAFTPTNTPDLLRLCNVSEADFKVIEIARKKVPKAAQGMHKSQEELLKYIRNTYKGIVL